MAVGTMSHASCSHIQYKDVRERYIERATISHGILALLFRNTSLQTYIIKSIALFAIFRELPTLASGVKHVQLPTHIPGTKKENSTLQNSSSNCR